jgi:hypothetical protein
MLRSRLALLIILLAGPDYAGSRFGGGFHGGGCFHSGGFSAFHRSGGRARGFFGGYGCGTIAASVSTAGLRHRLWLWLWLWGGAENAVRISNGLSGG